MSSPEAMRIRAHTRLLLQTARRSIRHGLETGRPLEPSLSDYPPELCAPRATFVTLKCGGALRGCTGSLEPRRPLVVDVAHNAYGSAFSDPRFPALAAHELGTLEVQLAILSPLERIRADCEEALVAELRPKIDGLVIRRGELVGTYLPAVWELFPDPRGFLRELKRKAGLPPDYWSTTLEVHRYTVLALP